MDFAKVGNTLQSSNQILGHAHRLNIVSTLPCRSGPSDAYIVCRSSHCEVTPYQPSSAYKDLFR